MNNMFDTTRCKGTSIKSLTSTERVSLVAEIAGKLIAARTEIGGEIDVAMFVNIAHCAVSHAEYLEVEQQNQETQARASVFATTR